MAPTTRLDEARTALAESVDKMQEWSDKAQSLPDDADEKEVSFVGDAFAASQRENKRWQETVDRLAAIESARSESAKRTQEDDEDSEREQRKVFAGDSHVKREEMTYTERSSAKGVSFFADLIKSTMGDGAARERLERHTREVAIERRDLTTVVTDGGNFVPPNYLGELYAQSPRSGRPFINAVGARPLMATGMTITIPRVTTGVTVAAQATENTAIDETELVEALLTVNVRTYAGQQDMSRQLFDRAEPGMDQIVFEGLRADYDQKVDAALLNGAGTLGTHLGIRAVASVNTVTYTDATPTAAEHIGPIYNAASQVWSNRMQAPDLIVMHPRRSAFIAGNLGTSFPVIQLGNLNQAAGTQDSAVTNMLAGLRVVNDPNVRTTDGASTNQDEIYVLRSEDLIFWEGPLQAEVMTQTAPPTTTDTLTVRLRLFAYSAFASGRYPSAISIISGTGLTVPAF